MNRIVKLTTWGLIMLVPAGAIAKSYYARQHLGWRSHIVASGKSLVFRSSTSSYNNGSRVALAFDRTLKKCSTQVIKLNFALRRPATRSAYKSNLFGQLRVDGYRIHNINYRMSRRRGSRFGFVYVTNFREGSRMLRELNRGRIVRFKLENASGKGYYFHFPMRGFRAATARARRLCYDSLRRKQRKRDEQYFRSSPSRGNNDRFL